MNLKKILKDKDSSEVIKKSSIALLIRVMGFLAGYIFIYYTIRYFGTETQGRLSLSFSFMIIGALLCRLGIDMNFVKIFAIKGNFNNAKGIYFKIIPYTLLLSTIISILIFVFSNSISIYFFNDPGLSIYLKWTSPCFVFFTFILLNGAVFRGLKKNALYSFLFNGGRFVFTLALFFLLLFFIGKTPVITVIAHTIAVFILFIISFYFIHKYLFPSHTQTNYEVKSFMKDSLPMLFSAGMVILLGWIDTIVLGVYENASTVGMYTVILKVSLVVSFTLRAINSILAPKLSSAYHSNDISLFKKLIKYSTLSNFIISTVIILLIIYFKSYILQIFGEEFLQISTALVILCIGQLFNAICGPVGTILQMTGHQIVYRNILFVAVLINLILNVSLIKEYGINGVAFATAFSLAFWNITAYIYAKKIVKQTSRRT